MKLSDIPTNKFPIPFANAAGSSYITTIPTASQIGITAGAASLTDGFVPLNFDPVGSGGVPPRGVDFNGLLKQITQWSRWQNAGGLVPYDSTFSTAIGGYPKGSILSSASTAGLLFVSTADDNTNNPDSVSTGWERIALISQLQSGAYNYAVAGGTANTITAALSPAPAALVAGMEIIMKMAAAPTGAVTINLNSLGAVSAKDSHGIEFSGGEWSANDIIVWNYNGSEFRALSPGRRNYKYDLSSPPGADVALQVGDKLTLTFSAVSTIPLYTATAEGLYSLKLLISATNTTDSNWLFKPNNTTYVNKFSYGVIEHADIEFTAFGSSTTHASSVNLTVSPYIGAIPKVDYNYQTLSSFFMDMFYGPSGSDTIQSRGPMMQEILVSTKTVAKMLRQSGQILASPSQNASYWHDTTTAWTSLGTLVDQGATSMTGLIVIERLA